MPNIETEDQAVTPDAPIAPQTETQFIRMWHSGLETEADFPASSVAMHAIAGWQVIDEPPEPEPAAEAAHIDRADVDKAQGITKSKAGTRRASQSSDADTGTSDKE